MGKKRGAEGVTRRDFIKTSLIGAAGVMAGASLGPTIVRAQQKPIRIGCFGVNSGPMGMTGESSFRAISLWTDEINKRGGCLAGKLNQSPATPRASLKRALGLQGIMRRTDLISFLPMVPAQRPLQLPQSQEISRSRFSPVSKPQSLRRYPKVRSPYCFRSARNTLLDGIGSAKYAAQKSEELGLTRWYTIANDYAFGRDSVNTFVEFLKKYNPKVEVIGQGWPKVGEPDFTPHITALSNARPQAVYDDLFAGDGVTFAKQGAMYGYLRSDKVFSQELDGLQCFGRRHQSPGKTAVRHICRHEISENVSGHAGESSFLRCLR